jgi:hypothetical protein
MCTASPRARVKPGELQVRLPGIVEFGIAMAGSGTHRFWSAFRPAHNQ